MTDKNITG